MTNNSGWACLLGVGLAGCGAGSAAPHDFQGIVELEPAHLGFEAGGRIQRLAVEEGDRVEAGAVLAELDHELARAVRAARWREAEIARAEAQLVQAPARRSEVAGLEARVRAAAATEALLERNLTRERALVAQQVTARAVAEELEGQLARARAERQSADAALATLRSGARSEERAGATARVEAAEAALAIEDKQLGKLVLRAGRQGRVLDVHVEPGEVVAAGTPVVSVGDTRHPYIEVFVPQGDLQGVAVGTRAEARVDTEQQAFSGRVEHVAQQTEFTPRFVFSERERPNLVVRVRVRVDDPDERLHAGVPAFVKLQRNVERSGAP